MTEIDHSDSVEKGRLTKKDEKSETLVELNLLSVQKQGFVDRAISQAGQAAVGRLGNSDKDAPLDFSPNPYKAESNSKFEPADKGDRLAASASKNVDERLADGRRAMNELAEKQMTQKYPSVINGKMYEYAPIFKQDMQKFEDRLSSGKVSKEEVATTYDTIQKMVEAKSPVTSRGERLQLAKNIMFHAGDPTKTDQGEYQTCAVTAEQERLFTRTPGIATKIIAEAATTGKWVAPDGKVIKLEGESLQARREAISGQPLDGSRSYATQILNNVLVNDVHQRKDKPEGYVQLQDIDLNGRPLGMMDSGERVFAKNGREAKAPDGGFQRAPLFSDIDVAQQIKRITGDTNVVISGKQLVESVNDPRIKNDPDSVSNVSRVASAQEFAGTLRSLKERNQFPAILGLDGSNPELSKGLPKEKGPKEDGPQGHIISVTDFDEEHGRVRISNQWGAASDRWISVEHLYAATNPKLPPAPKGLPRSR